MNEEEDYQITILINRILSGLHLFDIDGVSFCQKKANSKIKLDADLLYQKIYSDNLYSEYFLSYDDIKSILIENKVIDKNYDKIYAEANKKLDMDKISLYRRYKDKNFKEYIKEQIQEKKDNIYELLSHRHSLDFMLLHNFCNKIKTEYILTNTIYYYNTDQLVLNYDNLDISLFNKIISHIDKHNLKNIDAFKKLARSTYWKNIWSCNKNHIIDGPVYDWSEEQRILINLSKMYDSIYEHPEMPSEDIIDDNDALDGWMLFQKNKTLKEKKEKGVNNTVLGKNASAQQVFLMADNDDEAREIIGTNSWEEIQEYKQNLRTEEEKLEFLRQIDEINAS